MMFTLMVLSFSLQDPYTQNLLFRILKSGPQVHVDLNLLHVVPFTDVRYQFFALFLNPNVVLSRSRFAFL